MTLKFIKYIRLISFTVSAFFITSCEDPEDIGLSLQDQSDILNSDLVDTITISTSTVLLDDINTSTVNVFLVGAYDDPSFGNVSASSYFQLLLSSENQDFGSNPTCDSIKIFLDYNGYYYGDTLENQSIEVYKLTEAVPDDSSSTINTTLTTEASPLGTTDAGFVVTPTFGDSLVEIDLSTSYGNEIIAAGNTTNDLFVNSVYGLKLQPASGDFNGAVVGFLAEYSSAFSQDSRVVLYYHNDTDTSTFDLYLTSEAARFNNIQADRSATPLSSLVSLGDEVATSSSSDQGYIQAGTGLVNKLTFPHLQSFINEAGNVAINRAEILLYPVDGSTSGEHNEPPLFITMYKNDGNQILTDADGVAQIVANDDFNINPDASIREFTYDESIGAYRMRITQYLQDLVAGIESNNGVLLVPTINATRVSRTVFFDNNNVTNPAKTLKLLVHLTKLD